MPVRRLTDSGKYSPFLLGSPVDRDNRFPFEIGRRSPVGSQHLGIPKKKKADDIIIIPEPPIEDNSLTYNSELTEFGGDVLTYTR